MDTGDDHATGTRKADALHAEEVTRLRTMLSALATAGSGAVPEDDAAAIRSDDARAAATEGGAASAVPFPRKYFQDDGSGGAARAAYVSAVDAASHGRRGRPRPPPRPPRRDDAPRQRRWYAAERALLRELLVLTMRHADGELLRFVAPEAEPRRAGNGRGRPPDSVAEGVRARPRLEVLPAWRPDPGDVGDGDGDGDAGRGDDLAFRAGLSAPLLGSGARDALALCGECGWLYGRVASYVATVREDADGIQCATARALAARLEEELAAYHGHLASLEGLLPPPEPPVPAPRGAGEGGSPPPRYLTLRSLTARLPPIREHLRTLAMLADGVGARHLRGGKLLATVLRHSLDGFTRHAALVRSIAADCSVPWYRMLSRWMTQGVLEDVHAEFFVQKLEPEALGGDVAASSGFFTWHQRYALVEGLVPYCSCGGLMDIITVDLAHEVLLVGKGINFIRCCLKDRDWEVVATDKESTDAECNFATLSDTRDDDDELRCVSTLRRAVAASSARIHAHILASLDGRQHRLRHHLLALKHFLFLGQGDFVSSLVEGLEREFRDRTSLAGIYPHTLAAILDGAVRDTNARFLPEGVLGNLTARLMSAGNDEADRYWMGPPPKEKKVGMVPWKDYEAPVQDPWDFVYLDYKINYPLDAIVHAAAVETYHRVFLFLFRLKRVEWMLNDSWRQSTALNHAILVETKAGGADAPKISDAAERASYLLRQIASTRTTMLHFVSNLQEYLMFEVLEEGWEGLVRAIDRARSLDEIIRAHDAYLNGILDKTLLDDSLENGLEELLRRLLSMALTFGKFQAHVFGQALAGLDRAAEVRRRVEERADRGEWGRTTLDKEEGRVFLYLGDAELFEFVERAASEFDGALTDLLKMMSQQIDRVDVHTGMDDEREETNQVMKNYDALPFLLFRLDFSGYYARQAREHRKKEKHTS